MQGSQEGAPGLATIRSSGTEDSEGLQGRGSTPKHNKGLPGGGSAHEDSEGLLVRTVSTGTHKGAHPMRPTRAALAVRNPGQRVI